MHRLCTIYHHRQNVHLMPPPRPRSKPCRKHLNVLAHHSNHQVEKSNSLHESETKNSVREELSTHAGVTGNSHEESSEDHADTDSGTAETDGCGSHADVLGDLDHGGGDLGGEATLGAHVAGGVGEDLGGLLALDGAEGGGWLVEA